MSLCKSFSISNYGNLRFPIVFWSELKEEYNDFISSYDAGDGFLLTKEIFRNKETGKDEEKYVIYHGNFKYILKFFYDNKTTERSAFAIEHIYPLMQKDTLSIASLSIRITGLSKAYITMIDDLHTVQYTQFLPDFSQTLQLLEQLLPSLPAANPFWARLLEISEAKRAFDGFFTIRWPYASFCRGDKVGDTHEYIFQIAPPDEIIRTNEARFEQFLVDNGLKEENEESDSDPSIVTLRKRYISAFDAESGSKKFVEIPTRTVGGQKPRMLRSSIVRLELPGVTHDDHGMPQKLPKSFYKDDSNFSRPWQLVIAVKDESSVTVEDIPASGGTIQEQVSTDYDRYRAALHTLTYPTSDQHWSVAEDVVVRHTVAHFARKKEPIYHSTRLNPQQKAAIKMAINAPHFCLIQGPPGTGKTTIINEMLYNFIREGKKVLVCSKGNLAVDNVLEKWIEENKDRPNGHLCVRLGANSKLPMMKDYTPEAITDRLQRKIFDRTRDRRDSLCQEISQRLSAVSSFGTSAEKLFSLCIALAKLTELLYPLCQVYRTAIEKYPNRTAVLRKKLTHAQSAYDTLYVRMLLPAYAALCSSQPPLIAGFDARWQQVQADMNAALQKEKMGLLNTLIMLWYHVQWNWHEGLLQDHLNTLDPASIHSSSVTGNPLCELSGLRPMVLPHLAHPKQILSAVEDYRDKLSSYAQREAVRLNHIQTVQNQWLMELGSGVSQPMERHVVTDSIPVVGSTCMGIASKSDFANMVYDVVIVDEAGQIPIFDLMVPLIRAKKVVLIGDHRQLPPMDAKKFARYFAKKEQDEKGSDYETVLQEVQRWYNTSLFEMLYEAENLAHAREMLDTQFRMHPDISQFISTNFYGGKYLAGVTAEQRKLQIAGLGNPIYFYDTCQLENRFETKDSSGIYNETEAELTATILVRLILSIHTGKYIGPKLVQQDEATGKILGYDIGVISGYQAQVDLITSLTRKRLCSALPDAHPDEINKLMSRVAINTLDSFQGRDNQIILFSLTRSNETGTVGFLRDVRRLNVAMTRAKSLLIMIGDLSTLTATHARCAHDPNTSVASIFKNLKTYCINHKYYRCLKGGSSNGME